MFLEAWRSIQSLWLGEGKTKAARAVFADYHQIVANATSNIDGVSFLYSLDILNA